MASAASSFYLWSSSSLNFAISSHSFFEAAPPLCKLIFDRVLGASDSSFVSVRSTLFVLVYLKRFGDAPAWSRELFGI